jgi:predicted RNA binding protein YcfA (HicA-like mRNA interferase family)
MRPLPYRKVARRLAHFGFSPVRQKGSHVRFEHADGRATEVPRHDNEDIDRWLLMKIVKGAKIDPDEFFG